MLLNTPVTYATFPLLSLMTVLPIVSAIGVWRSPCAKVAAYFAYTGVLINLLLSIYLWVAFDTEQAGIQLAEHAHFWQMSYAVGLDNTNRLFIFLTVFLGLLAVFYNSMTRHADDKVVLASLLGYQAILLGAFAALNVLQFWFWTVLELLPVIVLSWHSGTGQPRDWVIGRFMQYWGGGLLMTLVGFMFLAFGLIDSEHALTFDWLAIKQNKEYLNDEVLIFVLLFFGFAVRMPLFPFHGWLPLLAEHGTVASSAVFLVGLKLGVYALIRYIMPIVSGVAEQWETFVVILSLISLFYGAILALMQINTRRLLAFAVVSQTGLLVIGVFSFNKSGLEGSLLLSNLFGLAIAGLFFCIGLLYQRTRTAFMPRLGGLFVSCRVLAFVFIGAVLSTIAIPATPILSLLDGAIQQHGGLMVLSMVLGHLLTGIVLLRAFQQIFVRPAKRTVIVNHRVEWSSWQEAVLTLVVVVLLLISLVGQSLVRQDAAVIAQMYLMHADQQKNNSDQSEVISLPLPNK